MLLLSRTFIFTICVVLVRSRKSWNDSNSLISDLLQGYNHRLRPVDNQSAPIRVYFTFNLMTIQDINEVEGKISVTGYLFLGWLDEKLTWNSSKYGGVDALTLPLNEVWHPTIVLSNSFDEINDIGEAWMVVEYNEDGRAFYAPGDVFTSSCSIDVTFYPFDYQVCYISFVSWGFSSGKVSLNLWGREVFMSHFTENGEWFLVKATPFKFPAKNEFEVDIISVQLIIKRRSTFLAVNVILPVVFISLINLLVFLLPAESGEKVSFAITVLLSLAIFLTLVINNLPQSSQPMAILCYYLMLSLVASVCMCITTIFNIKTFHISSNVAVSQCYRILGRLTCRYFNEITEHVERNSKNNNGIKFKSNRIAKHLPDKEYGRKINQDDEFIDDGNTDTTYKDKTWKDVSRSLDRVFFFVFLAILMAINVVFSSVMSMNTAPTW